MKKIRNVAIIAHVDHGKTTLVDKILHYCNLFSSHETPGDLILDSNDLEKERGITILSKNVSVEYKGVKINIIDTPGHADFGGEVERVLNMAEGVLLLVDAFEGPMPQTRFVLQKAIELNLKPVLVINKIDKPNCRPDIVQEMVFDLMFSLEASEDQLDFRTIYGSAKEGWMSDDQSKKTNDISSLLDTILDVIPPPKKNEGAPQLQITSIDYSSYIGRIAVGKVHRGRLNVNMSVGVIKKDGSVLRLRIKELMLFKGLIKEKADSVENGDICAITGLDGFDIGDTVTEIENPEAMPLISIDEPTMSMTFTINNSPFFGEDGKFVTSRHIKDRLDKETEKNLALRIEETESPEIWNVYGRGVLHLSVLIETMRREGYEMQVGQPKVIIKEVNGIKHEPIEELAVGVPEELSGKVIENVNQRKGDLLSMETRDERSYLVFNIPSRGIIGLRNKILTLTAGEAVINHRFLSFEPFKGEMEKRTNGSLISMDTGETITYALDKLQDRGRFFVSPGAKIYEGQVVGESTRSDDIIVNLTKTKKLTNMRASGADDKSKIAPATVFSLEESLEYIKEDEYVEATPKNIRLRKIKLKEHERKREQKS